MSGIEGWCGMTGVCICPITSSRCQREGDGRVIEVSKGLIHLCQRTGSMCLLVTALGRWWNMEEKSGVAFVTFT